VIKNAPPLKDAVDQALSRPEAAWILASNAIPIFGVLFFGWPAFSLLLFYWLENVVIGLFNVLKIAIAGLTKQGAMAAFTLFLVPFFVFHYGLFCYVHGVFVLAMFSFAGGIPGAAAADVDTSGLLPVVWRQLETDSDLRLGVVALIGVQAVWFLALWAAAGKWRTTNPFVQMIEPYGRILVLHLTIFVATIPVLMLGQTWIAVAALALLKAGMELGLPQLSLNIDKLKDLPPDKFPDSNP
jgi:hypothetical protein